ncbi:MBL fold metallo-hydrolase [Nonomuraea sp. NPDC052634]|uniref:MBL fold metallo-hydrolase n=1 Tax=Nonomuraea sp. NPDC052634 TaxID=3155813 RepID=UPI0034198BC9
MKIIEVRPELHLLLLEFGQAYLWNDGGELTVVDTGIATSAAEIAAAIEELGMRKGDVRRVVLTHHHEDHSGGAAEISGWGEVSVMAHWQDAPVIRGDVPVPPLDLTDEERELHRDLGAHLLPAAPPCRVDQELKDGDVIDFGGGAHVLHQPGHTDGSIALYLPRFGVLFTGDTVAHVNGQVTPGVFHRDRAAALRSFLRLADVDADLACVGHGAPITGARAALAAASGAIAV